MNRLTKLLLTLLTLLVLSACGGGGGGDAPPQELVYSGNTNSAVITLENATTLVGNVLYGGEAGGNIPVAVTLTEDKELRSAGAVVQSELLHSISQNVQDSIFKNNTSLPTIAIGVDLNEPLYCDSGSGNFAGTLNDSTFTGTLTVTYTNCLLDGVTYNGTGTFRIDAFDLNYIEITDATMTFPLMSISSPEFSGSMSGSIRIQSMIVSNSEKMTLNYVSKDNLTGKMYKFENMIHTTVYDYMFSPSNKTVTVTGTPARSFDSLHGYVDVDTLTPLSFSSAMLEYPDVDGIMLFTGVAGSSIRLTVLSGEHVQLELDIDGAPGYEILRILFWDEFAVNAKTDLTDTDNDGMHDTWETLYGLEPTVDDSAGDPDGDGFSNITEYLNGTDPSLHEIETLEIPVILFDTQLFTTRDYIGQSFKLQDNVSAESLTVYLENRISTAFDFRILVVELETSPELHPTNVLYESSTISISQTYPDPLPVTVNLGSINLNAGQTYAWILDGFVAYDGIDKYASIFADSTNSYSDGFMFTHTLPTYTGTREDHFTDVWFINNTADMSFTLEYRPIVSTGL